MKCGLCMSARSNASACLAAGRPAVTSRAAGHGMPGSAVCEAVGPALGQASCRCRCLCLPAHGALQWHSRTCFQAEDGFMLQPHNSLLSVLAAHQPAQHPADVAREEVYCAHAQALLQGAGDGSPFFDACPLSMQCPMLTRHRSADWPSKQAKPGG